MKISDKCWQKIKINILFNVYGKHDFVLTNVVHKQVETPYWYSGFSSSTNKSFAFY